MFIAERVYITDQFKRDKECMEHVKLMMKKIDDIQDQVVGAFGCEIESRFSRIRT